MAYESKAGRFGSEEQLTYGGLLESFDWSMGR